MVLRVMLLGWVLAVLLSGCASQPEQGVVPGLADEPAAERRKADTQPKPSAPPVEIPAQPEVNAAPDGAQPPAVTSVLDRASAALTLQQWKQASRYLDQAQRMAPRHPRVYLLYGDYYRALQKWAQARAMYQRCLSLSQPDSEWAHQARFRLADLP